MLRIASLIFCLAFIAAPVAAQQQYEPPLTNAQVVKLVRAGFKEKLLIAIIRSRPNRFDLSPDKLIELKRNGVPEKIIMAMLELDVFSSNSDDDWSEDSFFKNNKPSRGNGSADPNGEETNIFGSSGGSNSQTQSRGLRGSNQGETVTTGSATVRIIRPPAEAGGAALKLERTPTLNNESIIRLVEAGFSEGTIIKRIEDSPADFDLSPDKLSELRKRRVTEPIITAMTQAMEGSVPKTNSPGRNGES
ncbi:MAG TPA: hypothetical protein VJM12_11900 [Pyrinomonadaceae bacterium]|nr:hypothetical protein [Pyrinomonadaceae bacterium]